MENKIKFHDLREANLRRLPLCESGRAGVIGSRIEPAHCSAARTGGGRMKDMDWERAKNVVNRRVSDLRVEVESTGDTEESNERRRQLETRLLAALEIQRFIYECEEMSA